eukprot:TRINITY_DN93_c0_g1_i7.p1 TRINITY_DN93_c0_g1~~TRINITY_DN93_c0_g1_i7.p1  ORF type:complete len:131 (-),score=18.68 TRINITY_DN93_c0_g1_i7:85-477(-)
MSADPNDQIYKDKLTPEQFNVCRLKATERAFTGKYYKHSENGTYVCVCCGCDLFKSDHKYDSGSGWPSFYATANKINVKEIPDYSHGMARVEVVCSQCNSHLGHVFDDGPRAQGGRRFCINSASLDFKNA